MKKDKEMKNMEKEIKIDGIEYVRKDSIKSNVSLAKTMKGLKYVLIRTYSAGVFCGYLKQDKGTEVILLNARRLWYWDGASSLSQLSVDGVKKPTTCKFPCEVNEIKLQGVIEQLPMTEKARLSVAGVPIWQQ
jgi:hypothetical protein